ncbi:glycoside hydrolase family 99-like domain-containing protein [Claveliimonas bilis]|uniref:Glycosyl transferase n=1 Tax=Claveliimonas bilis TaxID=3028070 RepID=A0ABN6YW76_9FIRM|nr:glycoside hydrolase family 99-like domain-containing protein [Claveliimonas bilis]BDZ77310.1 glycosyl transferase [Claveliimonas bilis]
MKVLAMYLPQYHRMKENDEWWGEGYTEWTAVKSAKPCYRGHKQPNVPLKKFYYNLAEEDGSTWAEQAQLAREYGIYGFCIYHYWFKTGQQLMEKPMEILLDHPEIDINYCYCWANENWTRTWDGKSNHILRKQEYGDIDEWRNHFYYLLKFFEDPRYIKIDNKPVLNIYHSAKIPCLAEMKCEWNRMARENGFNGIYLVSGNTFFTLDKRYDLIDAYYNFEPLYTFKYKSPLWNKGAYKAASIMRHLYNKVTGKTILEKRVPSKRFVKWMGKPDMQKAKIVFPGACPRWDNTPRKGYKGMEYVGLDLDSFRQQLWAAKKEYKDSEFIYINAWNEWGESAYLEPDEMMEYSFLEVVRDAFKNS